MAMPPTAPPTIGPMGSEDFPDVAPVDVVPESVDDDAPAAEAEAEAEPSPSTVLLVFVVRELVDELVVVAISCSMNSDTVCGTAAQFMIE